MKIPYWLLPCDHPDARPRWKHILVECRDPALMRMSMRQPIGLGLMLLGFMSLTLGLKELLWT